jgi:two-component system sensor histidine kinase YesM
MLRFPYIPNSWKQSIFMRILIIFLIAIIPIYIVGICVFNWGISLVRQQTLNTKVAQLQFYVGSLESDMQRLVLLQSDYNNSVELNILSNTYNSMSEYDRDYDIVNLQEKLLSIKNSSSYAQNVTAYIPSIQKKISAVTGLDSMIPNDSTIMKINNISFPSSQIIYYQGGLYTNIIFQTGSQKPLYSILISISAAKLRNDLTQFNYDKGSSTLIMSDFNQSLVASASSAANTSIMERIVINQLKVASNPTEGVFNSIFDGKKYMVVFVSSKYLGFTVYNFVPESIFLSSLNRYQFWLWIFVILAAIIVSFFTFSIHRIIEQPLSKLIKAFIRVDKGDINFTITHNKNDEFASLYEYFNIMLQSLNTLINQSYKQRIMVQNAELKQLQAQINPHFLYNSYFLLHRIIKQKDYEKASLFSKYMGTYFQFITRSAKADVNLEKEVEHARIYTEMQTMRFEGRIEVEFGDLPPECGDMQVPRLILQPIVENAFEHGLKDKISNGILRVVFEKLNDGICILVEDNGEDLSDSDIEVLLERIQNEDATSETTGIINIQRRLQLMYGENSRLSLERSVLGGLCISLIIRPTQ